MSAVCPHGYDPDEQARRCPTCTVVNLAADVSRDMPDASLDDRMREAMRRCKGGHNPLWVREALRRVK